MRSVPNPNRPCVVSITNGTELPLTAVCLKFLLVSHLPPGEDSFAAACPTSENIEFQFGAPDLPYDEIEWASRDFELQPCNSYRIVVGGEPDDRSFSVVNMSIA